MIYRAVLLSKSLHSIVAGKVKPQPAPAGPTL